MRTGITITLLFEDIVYKDSTSGANYIIEKPTIWDEGRKSLELIMGTQKRKELTVDEFSARKRTTVSLVKLLKNSVIRMQILLAVDHYEASKAEKRYFSKRIQVSTEKARQEMMNTIPDQKELESRKVLEQRSAFMKDTHKELDEEVALVKKLKNNFLSRCYEFQSCWILQNVSDSYTRSFNKYSIKWRDKLNQLEGLVEENIQNHKEHYKGNATDYIIRMSHEVAEKWAEMIKASKNCILDKLKEIAKDAIYCEAQIIAEKEKKKRILDAIEKSSAIVQSILVQFEKLVTFGYKGKPGECNYFLSFQKLKELNEFLWDKTWKEKVLLKKAMSFMKIQEDTRSLGDLKSMAELTRENPSLDLQMFKHCIDRSKLPTFREEVLGVREIAQEVRCYADDLTEERIVEVTPLPLSALRADSAYIADKLTDAYRLAEKAYRKANWTKEELLVDVKYGHQEETLPLRPKPHRLQVSSLMNLI